MGALWRIGLQRMRADWPIVAAAWLITLLSAVLFSAGVIYPAAAAEAGLQRALRDTPPELRLLQVSRYDHAPNVDALDAAVGAAATGVIGAEGGVVVRDWRGSATDALAGLAGAASGDQAELGYLEGLADHATLASGAWPTDPGDAQQPSGSAATEVVLLDAAATTLGLHVGDEFTVTAHPGSSPVPIRLRLSGTFTIASPDDAFWAGDAQLVSGIHDNGHYRTFGPFLATRSALLAAIGPDELNLRWRIFPDFDRLAVDDAGHLAARIDAIAGRLLVDTGQQFTVQTALSGVLRDAERSLLVSRTSVVLLMAQLALLAGYAIVLVATLLVDHRRVDTALLRARGAGSLHVALLAFVEALVFAATAVAAAPTLGAGVVNLFNVVGPLADVGLRLVPVVTDGAYIAAAAAGLLSITLLVLPAALSARAFAQEQGGRSRQETRTIGQRLGLDVVLIAVTGIALWQLRLYGAPLTRSVRGQLGLDPLLVAAPAIGLVAGAVLALRMLPLVAQGVERAIGGARGLLTSLGARELARRPLRYTRSALLLVLAVSMGVFALSYAATWTQSQRDQARYQAGAAVRVSAASVAAGLPASALGGAIAALPDVVDTMPVERVSDGVKFATSGSADLLGLDAARAADIVLLRADATTTPFAAMLQPLAAARPDPNLATVPDGATWLRIRPVAAITDISVDHYDPDTDTDVQIALDPATVDVQMRIAIELRDGHGVMHQFRSVLQSVGGADRAVLIPLATAGGATVTGTLDGPVSIAALTVEVWLPGQSITSAAAFGIETVAAGPAETGPWTDVPLASAGPWSATFGDGFNRGDSVPGSAVHGVTVQLGENDAAGSIWGGGDYQPAAIYGFLPDRIDATGGPLPVIVNRAFLDAFGVDVGGTATAAIGGRPVAISVSGEMDSFPTTDPARPLAVIDEPTLNLLRLRSTVPNRAVDEWWIATRPGAEESVAVAVAGPPFGRPDSVSATGRTRELSTDPVALGIIGALTLGFITTGLFAIIGLSVSAGVSARQQRTEFALLRALGLSGRQLSASLWLEHGSVVVLGLLTGTGLGLLVAWLVLPFVTVTQGGSSPFPPVVIDVPWDRVLLLDAVSGAALALAILVIGAALRRLRVGATLRMGEDGA